MGRKRIYFTDEEKLAANRAKSKRYYHRRKAEIVKGRGSHSGNAERDSEENASTSGDAGPYRKSDPLTIWIEHAERLKRRMVKITEDSPAAFVDKMCRQFMYSLDDEPLKALSKKCSAILASINHCHNKVLQLAGVGPQLEPINETIQSVRKLISWIEEIECVIIIDQRDVFRMYADNQFMFQEV